MIWISIHFCIPGTLLSYTCDDEDQKSPSSEWKGTGWYRIGGSAGTKLLQSPVSSGHCGTQFPGTNYLPSEIPNIFCEFSIEIRRVVEF